MGGKTTAENRKLLLDLSISKFEYEKENITGRNPAAAANADKFVGVQEESPDN